MTQESTGLSDQPPSVSAPARTAPSLPPWLPYFLLAVVPALVVGVVVYAFTGSSGSNEAATVIDSFIRRSLSADEPVTTHEGKLPPEFPSEFPNYPDADIVVSFVLPSEEGTNYFAVLTTTKKPEEAYNFFFDRLDEGAWQVEAAQSSSDFTGILFTRPDNPDISGDVTIQPSGITDTTAIFISLQDIGATAGTNSSEPFVLKPSRPLPPGFPSDIPIFRGNSGDSVILDTYVQRGGGSINFFVSFLTKDPQNDVVNFYRQEFQKRGWTITDSETANNFSLGIDFTDGNRQEIQGTVMADSFEDDSSYTRVDLYLQVSASRGRGN
jgi:hypothetical protein